MNLRLLGPQSCWMIALFCLSASLTSAQSVGTYYTNAAIGFEAITWMPNGDIFTVDYYGGAVYRLKSNGVFETIGTGFSNVAGGGADADGNFYFSEFGTGKVYKVKPDGSYSEFASGFNGPVGLQLSADSSLFYVVNYNNNSVQQLLLADSSVSSFVSGMGLLGPDGVELAPNGDIIVANFNNNRLHRITPTGAVSRFSSHPDLGRMGYVVKAGDHYYVPSLDGHSVAEFDEDGTARIIAGSGIAGYLDGAADTARFTTPNGITANPAGDTLLVTEDGRIRYIALLDTAMTDSTVQDTMTTSIKELVSPSATVIFPQPFTDHVKIEYRCQLDCDIRIEVLDLSGKRLLQQQLDPQVTASSVYDCDLSALPAGIYLLQLWEQDSIQGSQKIVKE